MEKRAAGAMLLMAVGMLASAGCRNNQAAFSNGDSQFVLSANGTYTQTFSSLPNQSRKPHRGSHDYPEDPLDTLPSNGTWRLIGPSDGPGSSGFKVELSGVRSRYALPLAGTDTLVLPASSISGMDKLLREQKVQSKPPAP